MQNFLSIIVCFFLRGILFKIFSWLMKILVCVWPCVLNEMRKVGNICYKLVGRQIFSSKYSLWFFSNHYYIFSYVVKILRVTRITLVCVWHSTWNELRKYSLKNLITNRNLLSILVHLLLWGIFCNRFSAVFYV